MPKSRGGFAGATPASPYTTMVNVTGANYASYQMETVLTETTAASKAIRSQSLPFGIRDLSLGQG